MIPSDIVNNEIQANKEWTDSSNFDSKDKIVDEKGKFVSSVYAGRRYKLIWLAKECLSSLIVICSLGCDLFFKAIRHLFIQPKAHARFRIPVEVVSSPSIFPCSSKGRDEGLPIELPVIKKIKENTKLLVENPEKVLLQLKSKMDQLEEGWIKERLRQIFNYFSSESPLDAYYKEYRKQRSRFRQNLEEDFKKITEQTLKDIFSFSTLLYYDSFDVSHKKVIINGVISTDGWGDYFQMWLTAKNLVNSLPGTSIGVMANLSRKDSPPPLSKFIQNVKDLIHASEEDRKRKGVIKELKDTDLILNIPHGIPMNLFNKPVLLVEEYGFSPNSNYALGLSPMSFNILGIPLTNVNPAESLEDLSHASLRTHLCSQKRPFFLGYLKKDHKDEEGHRRGFVLAAAASHKDRIEDIDVICSFEDIFLFNLDQLKSLNIARVVLMALDEKGELRGKKILSVQTEGKEIRIINPFPLSNDDWMILLKFCEPLVGCTGDVSFSEVISNKKIPFYQIRGHKQEFMEQLIELAGYVYPEDFPRLHQFLLFLKRNLRQEDNSFLEDISKDCLDLGRMIDEKLIAEWEKFATYIQQYYCTNQILPSKIKQELAYAQYPELKKIEEDIFEQWKNDRITLQKACEMIQNQIKTL